MTRTLAFCIELEKNLSPFYLPCKLLGLNIFMRRKFSSGFYFCRLQIIFCMQKKCSFSWNCFQIFVQKCPKNDNYKYFLTKFVNPTHHFFAKNYSQIEGILKTNHFLQGRYKGLWEIFDNLLGINDRRGNFLRRSNQ